MNYQFKTEKFSINQNIYFTVDTTVINGNRICHLKTLKINYYGKLHEMSYKSSINRFIIMDGIRAISSVELINYLNKFLNNDNLYEIYKSCSEVCGKSGPVATGPDSGDCSEDEFDFDLSDLEISDDLEINKSCSATRCEIGRVATRPTSGDCSEDKFKNNLTKTNSKNNKSCSATRCDNGPWAHGPTPEVCSEDEFKNNNSCSEVCGKPGPWAHGPDSGDHSELENLILHKNDYNPNRYKPNLIQHNQFIKSELEKYRNSKYPICYKSFNEIKTIPVYCYVHPSLAINRKETIILCHLGYILEKLASYKSMPEFNTQAMISFLNITNKSSQLNETIEGTNKYDLICENERLRIELESKDKRINEMDQIIKDIRATNAKLFEKVDNLNATIKEDNQIITGLKIDINKNNQIITDLRSDLNKNTNALNLVVSNVAKMASNTIEIAENIKNRDERIIAHIEEKLPQDSICTGSTNEILLLIYRKSLDEIIHAENIDNPSSKLTEDDLILDTISCQQEDLDQHLYINHSFDEKEDQIIFKVFRGNSLDLNKFFQTNGISIKPLTDYCRSIKYRRKFVVSRNNLENVKKECQILMEKSNNDRTKIINSVNENSENFIIEKVQDPLKSINSIISEINLKNEENKKEITEILTYIDEKIDNQQKELNEKIDNQNKQLIEKIEKISNENQQINNKLDQILKSFATIDDLEQIAKGITQIYYNHVYRDLSVDSDGKIRFPSKIVNKRAINEMFLTYENILNGIFRDKKSKTYKPNENRKSIIESKKK